MCEHPTSARRDIRAKQIEHPRAPPPMSEAELQFPRGRWVVLLVLCSGALIFGLYEMTKALNN